MPQLEGSEHHTGKGKDVPGAHNRLLDDSLNLIKEHPAEVAAGVALAIGSIALLKAKALPTAGKELGAVAKAAEEGLLPKAAQHADGLTPLLDDIRSAASAGRTGPVMNDAANAQLLADIRSASSVGRTGPVVVNDAAKAPVLGAARESFDASVPKNVASAADIFAGLTQQGYRHLPYRIPAANIRMQQGASLMPDAVPNPFTREADGVIHGLSPKADVFSTFDQSAYRHVPYRDMAANIRLAQGPALRHTDGPSRIVFGEDNSVQHIFLNRSLTDAQKAEQVMTAGYAELIKSDVLAAKAAGKVTGRSIGFFPQPIERMATPAQMQENAVNGARAYLRMDESGANGFTKYLTELYGPMTKESQDLGRHIMTNPGSVESGWNALSRPATEILREAGLSINPLNRALAAHPNIMLSPPGERAATIRGGAQYLESRLSAELPEGLEGIARHAWDGSNAAALKPEVVRTISAVTQALGKDASRDFKAIEQVAEMVGAHGKPSDYVLAFQNLKGSEKAVAKLMTNPGSVESGLKALSRPATEILSEAGLTKTPQHIALAANPSIMELPAWQAKSTIKGGVNYLESRANAAVPAELDGMARQAWFHKNAVALNPAQVNTISEITRGIGPEACRDVKAIDQVAKTVGAHGKTSDYVAAFQKFKAG